MLIEIAKITRDPRLQLRAMMNREVIAEWAQMMSDGVVFPPAKLIRIPTNELLLVDGFHRLGAAEHAGRDKIEVLIEDGTFQQALLAAAGANLGHGIRVTSEDKRRAVRALLSDEELAKLSDREIARRTGTTHPFVSKMRAELEVEAGLARRRAVALQQLWRLQTEGIERLYFWDRGDYPIETLISWMNITCTVWHVDGVELTLQEWTRKEEARREALGDQLAELRLTDDIFLPSGRAVAPSRALASTWPLRALADLEKQVEAILGPAEEVAADDDDRKPEPPPVRPAEAVNTPSYTAPGIRLPLDATVAQIAQAIKDTQAKCKKGLADEKHLANQVRKILDQAAAMAAAVGQTLEDLQPSGDWWTPNKHIGDYTTVCVHNLGITVKRSGKSFGSPDVLLLRLAPSRKLIDRPEYQDPVEVLVEEDPTEEADEEEAA